MKKNKTHQKEARRKIAQCRINRLFYIAQQNAQLGRIDLANRNVEIARKISMRYLTPIPNEFKRSFCKHCYSFLIPSVNCKIRIHHGRTIIYCNTCEKYTRIPFK